MKAAIPDCNVAAPCQGFDHFLADKILRRERMAEYIRERELRRSDYNQRRWSNREQAEFYRTISTYGVEYIRYDAPAAAMLYLYSLLAISYCIYKVRCTYSCNV